MKDMLLWAVGTTLVLTLVDKVTVASNLPTTAIVLTLMLYGMMSLTLIPLAWIMKNSRFSMVLNAIGAVGAFAGVNFTMDCIRTFFPLVTK
jgi:hypothetical protein